MARYIGSQSIVSAIQSRASTTTRAAPEERSVVVVAEPMPSPEDLGPQVVTSDERSLPAFAVKLPDLQSDGPAPDGFVLSLLEESEEDAPKRTRGIVNDALQTEKVEPSQSPTTAVDRSASEESAFLDAFDPTGALTVLPDEVERGVVTAISVSAHPLASWMGGIDDALRERWQYPAELRALGVDGTVELKFTVLPSGRVVDVRVVAATGPAELTFAAMGSVPTSVPPPPAGWGRLDIHYTFRYRAASRLSPGG